MFKKIINNLFGNTPPTAAATKPAAIEDVREVVYSLMARSGSTTTLDVKNELRRQGFQAFQDQVSQMVSAVAGHDLLASRNTGKYNVYSFGADTSDNRHVYLQSSDQFWEGIVEGKTVTVYTGRVGTDGEKEAYECYKNRLAVRELERLTDEKVSAGYGEATDARPPLAVRVRYGHLLGRRPTSCSIGYYNVVKKEYSAGQVLAKSAGYRFTWHLAEGQSEVAKVLNAPSWRSTDVRFDHAQLLGEKLLQRHATDAPPGETVLEADNAQIYQVEISFENGETAVLSKFQLHVQGALLPLARRLLLADA